MSPSTEITEDCPLCGSASGLHFHELPLRIGRRTIRVQGLKRWVCGSCAFEFVDEAQSAHNLGLIESATRSQQGAVTPGLMRRLRKTWGLTQAMASKLFGAGDSSFAKWESGQSNISRPAALLLQTASHVPGVMTFLADLAQMELHPEDATGWDAALQQARLPTAYQNWTTSVDVEHAPVTDSSPWYVWPIHPSLPANDAYMEIARQARISDWQPHFTPLADDQVAA